MIQYLRVFGLLILSTAVYAVAAEAIYETKGKDGAVEFSDQSSPDAHKVTVDPNVVKVTPVKPLEPLPERTPQRAARTHESDGVEVVHRGYGYLDDEERRRRRVKREAATGSEKSISHEASGAVHHRARHR